MSCFVPPPPAPVLLCSVPPATANRTPADRHPFPARADISLPVFFGCWIFWKLYKRTKWVSLEDMDFVTGRRELDEMMDLEEEREEKPRGVVARVWAAFAG